MVLWYNVMSKYIHGIMVYCQVQVYTWYYGIMSCPNIYMVLWYNVVTKCIYMVLLYNVMSNMTL